MKKKNSEKTSPRLSPIARAQKLLFSKEYAEAYDAFRKIHEKAPNIVTCFYLGILYNDFGCGIKSQKDLAERLFLNAYDNGVPAAAIFWIMLKKEKLEGLGLDKRTIYQSILPRLEEAAENSIFAQVILKKIHFEIAIEEEDDDRRYKKILAEYKKILEEAFSSEELSKMEKDYVSLFLSQIFLSEDATTSERIWAFGNLKELAQNWNSHIATKALNLLAKCYRDGIFINCDLQQAEKFYLKAASIGTAEKEIELFRSGKWKHVPAEKLLQWRSEHFREHLRKIRDRVFLAFQDWLEAEESEALKEAIANFEIEETTSAIQREIDLIDEFYEGEVSGLKTTFTRAARRDLESLVDDLEEFHHEIQRILPLLEKEKTNWLKEIACFGLNFGKGFVAPWAVLIDFSKKMLEGDQKTMSFADYKNQERQEIAHRMDKIYKRIKRSEENLIETLKEHFEKIEKDEKE